MSRPVSERERDNYKRMKKTTAVHLSMEAKKTLQVMKDDFPGGAEAMDYFYDRLEALYDPAKSGASLDGKQLIGTLCVHVPEEIIYAAGAVPVRLCSGAYAADQAGAEFMPARSCPLIKSTLGMTYLELLPHYEKLSLIVNPTTCDQKKKFGEILGEFSDKTFTLEVPPAKNSEEARIYWQRVVRKFVRRIEGVTGRRITRKSLKESLRKTGLARAEFRRFHNLRKKTPVIFGKDAIAVMNTYFFDDIDNWTEALARLNTELEKRKDSSFVVSGANAPRILFAGSPSIFPNLKLPVLVEQLGGVIVADETCSSNRLLYDMVAVDEGSLYDMLPAVADRYLKPCTCPNFTPNTDRDRKVIEMSKDFSVDGIVYQAFSGCQLFEMEARKTAGLLEEKGVPMLYIETDYSPEDSGQLSTRVEAFLETLKAKKRRAE